jgi:hypothetical protein
LSSSIRFTAAMRMPFNSRADMRMIEVLPRRNQPVWQSVPGEKTEGH